MCMILWVQMKISVQLINRINRGLCRDARVVLFIIIITINFKKRKKKKKFRYCVLELRSRPLSLCGFAVFLFSPMLSLFWYPLPG